MSCQRLVLMIYITRLPSFTCFHSPCVFLAKVSPIASSCFIFSVIISSEETVLTNK